MNNKTDLIDLTFHNNKLIDLYLTGTIGFGGFVGMVFGLIVSAALPIPLQLISFPFALPLGGFVGMVIGPFVPPILIILSIIGLYKNNKKNTKNNT